ncbi:hypothetical protein Patl1_18715 [Pistacia atlantica]|uniref:Uncharacterized protein n=1 Tax=Pistacia atlantica TaxID=434234 RepID=A0ACC1C1U2_9ROSI|nr:hypothetical protein Patl1_18715 [Pistacia atlantica]
MSSCLTDCYELYSDAISTLQQATKDYKSKHYEDANFEISSVMDASTTCEDGFKEQEGVASYNRNNNSFQLFAIALPMGFAATETRDISGEEERRKQSLECAAPHCCFSGYCHSSRYSSHYCIFIFKKERASCQDFLLLVFPCCLFSRKHFLLLVFP